ncbi:MAG TPA: hypothetical protein VH575_03485 [Gemmataceae bacterium]|jgi:hypothetical protein
MALALVTRTRSPDFKKVRLMGSSSSTIAATLQHFVPDVEVKRLVDPFLWLVQPLLAPPRGLGEANAADQALPRFLAWRLRVLVLVILLTALTAAIDTATRLVGGPRLSFTILLKLEPESEPVQQTFFRRPGRPDLAAVVLRHAGIVPARGGLLGQAAGLPVDPGGWMGGIVSSPGGHCPDAVELVERGARGGAASAVRADRRRGGLGLLLRRRPQPGRAGASPRYHAGLHPREDAAAGGGAAGLAPGGGGPL